MRIVQHQRDAPGRRHGWRNGRAQRREADRLAVDRLALEVPANGASLVLLALVQALQHRPVQQRETGRLMDLREVADSILEPRRRGVLADPGETHIARTVRGHPERQAVNLAGLLPWLRRFGDEQHVVDGQRGSARQCDQFDQFPAFEIDRLVQPVEPVVVIAGVDGRRPLFHAIDADPHLRALVPPIEDHEAGVELAFGRRARRHRLRAQGLDVPVLEGRVVIDIEPAQFQLVVLDRDRGWRPQHGPDNIQAVRAPGLARRLPAGRRVPVWFPP